MSYMSTSQDDSISEINYEDEPCISPIKELRETFLVQRNSQEKKQKRKVSFNDQEVVLLFEESDPPEMVSEDLILYEKQTGVNFRKSRNTLTSILKKGY